MYTVQLLEFQLEMEEMRHSIIIESLIDKKSIKEKINDIIKFLLDKIKEFKNKILVKLKINVTTKYDIHKMEKSLDTMQRNIISAYRNAKGLGNDESYKDLRNTLYDISDSFDFIPSKEDHIVKPADIDRVLKNLNHLLVTVEEINDYVKNNDNKYGNMVISSLSVVTNAVSRCLSTVIEEVKGSITKNKE